MMQPLDLLIKVNAQEICDLFHLFLNRNKHIHSLFADAFFVLPFGIAGDHYPVVGVWRFCGPEGLDPIVQGWFEYFRFLECIDTHCTEEVAGPFPNFFFLHWQVGN